MKAHVYIKSLYKGEAYNIRLKAPVLATLTIVVIATMIPITILNIINNESMSRIIFDILIIIVVFAAFVFVIKKKYNLATLVFLFGLIIPFATIYISQSFVKTQLIHANANSFISVLIMAVLFTNSKKQTLIFSFITFIIFISSSVIALLNGNISGEVVKPIVQVLIPSILMLAAIYSFYMLKSIESKILEDINEKLSLANINEVKRRDLLHSSAKQLEKTHELSDLAEKAISASNSIKESLNSVTDQVNMLEQNFGSSSKALDQITKSVDKLNDLSENQTENVNESSASIEEMAASIGNVSNIIENRTETVTALRQISSTGEDTLENTIDSFDSVLRHLDSIKEMTSIIDSIASQTNLLSMNAAIESAHAGDAGKGFAVVADEIRKLAESSSLNAKEITVTLSSLVDSIEKAGQDIHKSGSSFKEMHKQISEVSQGMNEISSNANELSVGSQDVLRTSTKLKSLNLDVSDSVKEVRHNQKVVYSDINDVLGSTDAVLQSVTHMMENISEISEEVIEIKANIDLLIRHSEVLKTEIEA